MTTANPKLHEIVAVRKGVKSRVYSEITSLHRDSNKGDLYTGLSKEYSPKDDGDETLPPESKKVQIIAEDTLKATAKLQSEAWDIEATQEWGNQTAKADIMVAGRVLMADVPVTLLIHMDKQLNDMRTFVAGLPTLDPAKDWDKDPNSKLFRTKPTTTHRTKKVEKPHVVVAATKEHPAQWTTLKEDVTVGYWNTTHLSGALPVPRKEALLERIDALQVAIKKARSRANDRDVERKEIGEALFGYLFAS
jgi:hypothetical protein